MCGINGFIKAIDKQGAEAMIHNMNQAIIHRGPDDQGFFVSPINPLTPSKGGITPPFIETGNTTNPSLLKRSLNIAQGQVRLAIIDLSDAGFQPMFYDRQTGAFNAKFHAEYIETIGEQSLRIVFNGEIYNYEEIKLDLLNKGYVFSTKSDTEVILASYLERGQDCVTRFNGMRAFALYNPANQELFCSRDRLGKKPFYYYFDGDQFIFCSEIKGILKHKALNINVKENIDPEALDFYFSVGYIPAPWTIYKNVKKLEARHSLVVSYPTGETTNPHTLLSDGLMIKDTCYYEIPDYKPINDKKLLLEEGKKLLEDSVKIRMFTSDVPVGAFLSGGLDSSSVVGEMRKRVDKEKLNTFSIGFEGKYDETKYINIVKDTFGTNHHHKYFKEADFESMLDDMYFYYDEPFADYSNFPTTFVSQLAKEYVTVSLSGDGGDEIFGGYMMHQVGAQMTLMRKIPRPLRQLLSFLTPKTANNLSLLSKIKEAFRVSLLPLEDFYGNIGGSSVYKPEIYKLWTTEKMKELLAKTDGNFTQAMIDFDLFYNTLADNFLVKTDRASMAQPLEIRSPFLDVRWIDRSRKTPTKRKVNFKKTKILMREIIKDIVPEAIINRGKQGFEPPLDKWILEGKYRKDIEAGIGLLEDFRIDRRAKFYKNNIITQKNKLSNIYTIRLFLFIKWYKKWI